ncbi:VHS-domain-containing protein [Marasmius fiardii PR-910]|nr:VHS-domain-containing protein [Marasmius fiardii PR-910]
MSALSSWLWGTSQLDDAVDKATSELLPAGTEDIALNLEICDQIRSKSAPAKDAMRALKRRLNHKNPNVQVLALSLTDICVKNGGDHFVAEIASREFIDNLVSILKIPNLNHEVKNNILRHIQNWSVAFEGKPSLSYVGTVYKTLLSEGFKFPPKDVTATNSVMFDTSTAPEWIDSDVCLRCRTPFTFTNRKHHCRNCGQVFDQQCSSKSIPLPHFGITQDVRVCDGCYNKLHKRSEKTDKKHRHSSSMHNSRHRLAQEFADAELQRAIQLSLQEVGAAGGHRPGYTPSQPTGYSEPPLIDRTRRSQPSRAEEDDPDLKAAIEASLREANAPKPSAPMAVETPHTEEPPFSYSGTGYSQSYPPGVVPPHPVLPKVPNYDLEPLEEDAILTFSQTVEQVQAQGRRDLSRYPAVNDLYDKASSLRPKLALSLDDAGRKQGESH